jgi:hypothetical protein
MQNHDLLSAALDEIFRLRRALSYEAAVVEAHYAGYKTFPKSRRKIAEQQVARMRQAATQSLVAYAGTPRASLKSHSQPLTVDSWQQEVNQWLR